MTIILRQEHEDSGMMEKCDRQAGFAGAIGGSRGAGQVGALRFAGATVVRLTMKRSGAVLLGPKGASWGQKGRYNA